MPAEDQFYKVMDHFDNVIVTRPLKIHPGQTRLKYDFDFRKVGSSEWRYMNSTDNYKSSVMLNQMKVTSEAGGEWRILNSDTGELVISSWR
jgi:hypothetical protein